MAKIFIDLDGVLADFDKSYFNLFNEKPNRESNTRLDEEMWKKILDHGSFFRDLPLMEDAHILWNYCVKYRPIILTGCPKEIPEAAEQKRDWVKEKLGNGVQVITCKSKEKSLHCNRGDILIDDWVKYKQLWLNANGVWITHISAENSVKQLQEIGI